MSGSVVGMRRRRAGAIVAVLFVGLAAALVLASADRPSVLREAVCLPVEMGDRQPGADFEEEVVSLGAKQDVQVDKQNGVVGFCCGGSPMQTLAVLEQELYAKGWSGVRSGSEGCASFVKGSGRYRWMFVACTGVGDTTSVVVRYTTEKGA